MVGRGVAEHREGVAREQRAAAGLREHAPLERPELAERPGMLEEVGELARAGVAALQRGNERRAHGAGQPRPEREPARQPGQVAERGIAPEQLVAPEP